MLGGHGVGHDGGQEHNPQREHEFEADPFAQPLAAGLAAQPESPRWASSGSQVERARAAMMSTMTSRAILASSSQPYEVATSAP